MPVTRKQKRMFCGAAHSVSFRRRMKIPLSVAREMCSSKIKTKKK